jgi:hypothetical protein
MKIEAIIKYSIRCCGVSNLKKKISLSMIFAQADLSEGFCTNIFNYFFAGIENCLIIRFFIGLKHPESDIPKQVLLIGFSF